MSPNCRGGEASATDRRRASPGIVHQEARWTAGKASPSRSAVVEAGAPVSGRSNADASVAHRPLPTVLAGEHHPVAMTL